MHQFVSILFFLFLLIQSGVSNAQNGPNPEGAFIRSLIVPGWGHYYANSNQWTRGQVHLGMEVALIASYVGFSHRADNLENQYETLASLKSGIDVTSRSRSFKIAIGDFNTLHEYNNFQLRSRHWNRLFEDQPENRWNWQDESDRDEYNNLRSDVDRVRNQLPAFLGLMIVNRVVSALSAYRRVKRQTNTPELTLMPISTPSDDVGVLARLNLHF